MVIPRSPATLVSHTPKLEKKSWCFGRSGHPALCKKCCSNSCLPRGQLTRDQSKISDLFILVYGPCSILVPKYGSVVFGMQRQWIASPKPWLAFKVR